VFVLFLIACQLALAFTAFSSVRLLARGGSFAAGLLMLMRIRRRAGLHPAAEPAAIALVIVTLSLLHPLAVGVVGGAVQLALYCAILGPLFWVPRLSVDVAVFRRAVLVLWLFGTASATVGVLQVYYPGEFQPNLSTVIAERDDAMIDGLKIVTSTGETVFRPMGLTDTPGGAALGGFYAVLFGMGFLLTATSNKLRVLCGLAMVAGMTVLYLSQIRSILVLAVLCALTLLILLIWRGHLAKVAVLGSTAAAAIVVGLIFSISLAGEAVVSRLTTLVDESPAQVYYQNRGFFLEYTVSELVPEYPLGAGLGRWGMTNAYFGGDAPYDRAPIWVEIQWTGWLLDGGVPLVIAYVVALALAVLTAVRIAARRGGASQEIALWAALVVSYDIGVCALTFNYPFFISQSGMEFWAINAALFAAANTRSPAAPTQNGR
jgi:hypothetical protein